MSNKNFPKNLQFMRNVENCCRIGQAIYGNITRSMRFPCWVTNATKTHSEYIIFIDFSEGTRVARTCLNVTLYLNCLSCFNVHHHHHHQYTSNMELGHWLTRSGMTRLVVSPSVSSGLNVNPSTPNNPYRGSHRTAKL